MEPVDLSACRRLLTWMESHPHEFYEMLKLIVDPSLPARVNTEVERIFAKEREAQ